MTLQHTESRQLQSIETPEVVRVNPTLAIFQQLDDMNLNLLDILTELRHRPTGHIMPLTGLLTGVTVVEQRLRPIWFSFVLTNDGPGSLEFAVNDISNPFARLEPRETLPVDFSGSPVNIIYLRSRANQTANYRIFGVY